MTSQDHWPKPKSKDVGTCVGRGGSLVDLDWDPCECNARACGGQGH